MSNRRTLLILFCILFGMLAAAFFLFPKKQPPTPTPVLIPELKVSVPPAHYDEYQDGKG